MFSRNHRAPRPRRRCNLRVEALEQRRLLSVTTFLDGESFTVDGDVLTVHTSPNDDNIVAFVDEEGVLNVEWETGSAAASGIEHLEIFSEGGDDTIVIKDSVYQTTMLDGGLGDDTITGSQQEDTIKGGWGDDELNGSGGNDTIIGDPRDFTPVPVEVAKELDTDAVGLQDVVDPIPLTGNDTITGGRGNDTINGKLGRDTIDGGRGNDTIDGGSGADTIQGGWGDDTLRGGAGNDTINGDPLDITPVPGPVPAEAVKELAADAVSAQDVVDPIPLTGNDTITGGHGNDTINGKLGRDTIDGGRGNDTIDGGSGADTIRGGRGDDTIDGGSGNDTIDGGSGNDTIQGGVGGDTIHGGTGNDTIHGDPFDIAPAATVNSVPRANYNDVIYGGNGDDVISGMLGGDRIFGGRGDDTIKGGSGVDWLWGQLGDDEIEGGFGNDYLFGEDGEDTLLGDAGDDFLSGGRGSDVLRGGLGADFLFSAWDGAVDDVYYDNDDTLLVDGFDNLYPE